MNKSLNNFKKKLISTLTIIITLSSITFSFADGARVVTLGADLSEEQKNKMLSYFGVNKDEVVILEVNNQEERAYLEGIASEAQLGTKTFSCAYVEPTASGNGINVKTANLTWLTSSMVASTLTTAGLTDANCVVASVFPVSGTGALTGIMKAFEDATGEALDEEKKELASEELIITGDLGEEIGQDKATGVINDIKTEIIKNNTSDTNQIAETINNVTNNYNITLNPSQQQQIEDLMVKISEQDYNYNEMKDTLNGIKDIVDEKLEAMGEDIKKGVIETITGFFTGIGDWFAGLFDNSSDMGILENTNDSLLGENAVIDATNEETINLPTQEEAHGFFEKIWNWFIGLFNNDSSNESLEDNTNEPTQDNPINENLNNNEEMPISTENTIEENIDNKNDVIKEEVNQNELNEDVNTQDEKQNMNDNTTDTSINTTYETTN